MSGNARTLLKEATALKRARRYDEAVAMLRRAYDAPTESPMTVQERLRLPMYLQLAGRADEGWSEMNRLNITYVDQFSQVAIAAQMATFLRKEGNYKNAALFDIWTFCKKKEVDVGIHASMVRWADRIPTNDAEREIFSLPPIPWSTPPTGTTPSGNPIHDVSYPSVHRRLNEDYGVAGVRAALGRDLTKMVANEAIAALVSDLSSYIAGPPPYDLVPVRTILAKHLA